MSLSPWIRRYNYIQDYFYTTYQHYIEEYPAYPVTYYMFDFENSVGDWKLTETGSYEKLGVGPLSGYVWKKIIMLPVFGIDPMQPLHDSGDTGLHFKPNLVTNIEIPDSYGIKPTNGIDMVDLDFGLINPAIKDKTIFVVDKFDLAHTGDFHQLYKCGLEISPIDRSELEKQISETLMFHEFSHKILPYDKVKMLLKIHDRATNIGDKIGDQYSNPTGFYLRNVEV